MPFYSHFGRTLTGDVREHAGSHASVTTSIHPQMLRLNELAVSNQQQSAEAPGPAAAAGHLEIPTQKAKLAPFNPNLKADAWLLKMDLKGAEGGPPMQPPPALLLDLNDPNMTFEVLRGTEVEAFASAAATILPAMPKVLSLLSYTDGRLQEDPKSHGFVQRGENEAGCIAHLSSTSWFISLICPVCHCGLMAC